jgi:hypothetical protein
MNIGKELNISYLKVLPHSTFIGRSNDEIVGLNPTQNMGVSLRLSCVRVVLCVGSGLATS